MRNDSFEERLARVIGRTLRPTLGLVPLVWLGCDRPDDEPRCGDGTPTHEAYLLVDDGAACPPLQDVTPDELHQLGCACPFIRTTDVCEVAARVDAPTDGTGYEVPDKDGCGYVVVGVSTGVCCGRPLLRDGSSVVAPLGGPSDWRTAEEGPDLSTLRARERALLAAYWTGVAQMEHASVASFARFTLELMEHGAPAELLSDAQQAGLDEVRHALDAFALASAYAGATVAPGPMDLSGVVITGRSLVEVAVACVEEGCIGETLAAVEAAHRLVQTTDPAVARALRRVVEDEGRHAAMAWRALSWLLEVGGEPVREAVEATFSAGLERAEGPEEVGGAVRHGLLRRSARQAAFQQAWSDVIQPAWKALACG